jgi:hypothetical protein
MSLVEGNGACIGAQYLQTDIPPGMLGGSPRESVPEQSAADAGTRTAWPGMQVVEKDAAVGARNEVRETVHLASAHGHEQSCSRLRLQNSSVP